MKKQLVTTLFVVLVAWILMPVSAETRVDIKVDDSLFVTFEFRNLNQTVYDQAQTQFGADKIPEIIVGGFEKRNQSVRWGPSPIPLDFEGANRTIRNSFFLGGSSVVSFSFSKTEPKRMYEVRTDWRKFKVNLTDSFSVDFAQYTAKPVAEWEKGDATTFYLENRETSGQEFFLYLVLPASASSVRAVGDTVFFDTPLHLEDQLLYSPFPILGALAVALVIILLYRKVR